MIEQMIEIVASDPGWPAAFEDGKPSAFAALGTLALRVDHHGSTSIPGLAAKPIIDIQVSARGAPAAGRRMAPGPRDHRMRTFRVQTTRSARSFTARLNGLASHHVHVGRAGRTGRTAHPQPFATICVTIPVEARE